MKIFLRLLSYIKPYRYRFALGVLVSFFVAALNGLSLSLFIPFFEALELGEKSGPYLIEFKERERALLEKALYLSPVFPSIKIPPHPQKLEQKLSQNILGALALERLGQKGPDKKLVKNVSQKTAKNKGLSLLEKWELQILLHAKLRINAAGLSPMQLVLSVALLVLPLWSLKLLLILVCVRLIARSGYLAVRNIREALYLKVQRLGLTWFYRNKSGELVSRLSNDAEIVAAVISSNMRDAVTNFFYLIVHVLILAYLNLELLFIAVIAVPLLLSPITLFTRKIRKATHRSQNLMAEMHGHIQEAVSGMKLIRFMQMEDYETQRFQRINERLYWRRFKEIYYNNMGPYLAELNSIIVILGILSLGAIFIERQSSNFSSSEFLVFVIALTFIIRPINQLASMYAKIQGAIAAGKRIFEIMDKEFESQDPPHPLALQPLKKNIQFKDLCFSYPESEEQVLHNINLDVPVGATVALVGESGGGKSTLMDLLARFFKPASGQILFDGQDIQDFRVLEHRSRIGIVTQEIFLFHGNIYENIAYGKENANHKEVEKAARLAYAHDFIHNMPKGYKSSVDNRGLNLSGGQRQRIAIARALLRDPEILILDEATSALDTQSEKLVQQALERLFRNRTTFIIAHRLSTVEKADIIIVIAEGKIVEQGSHKSLLKKDGYYASLQRINQSQQMLSPKDKAAKLIHDLVSLGRQFLSSKKTDHKNK